MGNGVGHWRAGLAAAIALTGTLAVMAAPAGASEPYPDPGFPLVPCPGAGEVAVLTESGQLDPTCDYSGGVEITASDVTLDCRGVPVETEAEKGAGIKVHTPVDEDMSGVVVRNCVVDGFTNGIRVTRDGFRGLAAGEEYDHALKDVKLEGNRVSGTRGVGIYVDGYVTETTVSDNTISGAGSSGVYLEAGSADNVIASNQIIDNGFRENGPDGQTTEFGGLRFRYWGTGREGISIDGSRRNVVSDNTLSGNSAGGIYLYTNCGEYATSKPGNYFPRRYGATGNLIIGNRLTGGVSGVWVGARMGESLLPMECGDEPYFEDGLTQIILDRAADNTVRDNVFSDVTYGVRVEDDETKVIGNSFSGPDGGQYAVIVGTPYRTSVLGRPVKGTQLIDNRSTIVGNPSPYRWVDGQADSTVNGNLALGQEVEMCEGKPLPRGPFVMTIAIAYEPEGSEPVPPPDDLAIPGVGPQTACPRVLPPPPDTRPDPDDPPTVRASNQFQFRGVKLNKRRGTATLKVRVTGAGKLRLNGTRTVKKQGKTPRGAATVKLTIRARGKAARKLNRRGSAKVRAKVTFTPTGGLPRTKARWVRLVKKAATARGGRGHGSDRTRVS